jgi:hypothetical protein
MALKVEAVNKLVGHINRKDWWHVPPRDPTAYRKRGKFYASSLREAEFWGRPLDQPQRVSLTKPLIGDEDEIETRLLGRPIREPSPDSPNLLEWRWRLDAKLKRAALANGYDCIVLMTPKAFAKFRREGQIPRSIELNLLNA